MEAGVIPPQRSGEGGCIEGGGGPWNPRQKGTAGGSASVKPRLAECPLPVALPLTLGPAGFVEQHGRLGALPRGTSPRGALEERSLESPLRTPRPSLHRGHRRRGSVLQGDALVAKNKLRSPRRQNARRSICRLPVTCGVATGLEACEASDSTAPGAGCPPVRLRGAGDRSDCVHTPSRPARPPGCRGPGHGPGSLLLLLSSRSQAVTTSLVPVGEGPIGSTEGCVPSPSPPRRCPMHTHVCLCVHARRARRVRAEGPQCTPRGRCSGRPVGGQLCPRAGWPAAQARRGCGLGAQRSPVPRPSGTVGGLRDPAAARALRPTQPQCSRQKLGRQRGGPFPSHFAGILLVFQARIPRVLACCVSWVSNIRGGLSFSGLSRPWLF